ncbi:MAG: response regulator transcription factor [Myxococcota bacterium]
MIRVFVADDHALVREGLKRFLADEEGMVVVGEAATAEEMLETAQEEVWDVLLLDLSLPDLSGLEALKRIKKLRPRLRVVIVTMQNEDQYALRILKAGADGYVTKGHPPGHIADAIRKVFDGGKYLTPALAELLFSSGDDLDKAPHARLSDRERDVLVALGQGKAPGAIAAELGLSPSTISTHLSRIKQKLSKQSVPELVRYAVEAGLV